MDSECPLVTSYRQNCQSAWGKTLVIAEETVDRISLRLRTLWFQIDPVASARTPPTVSGRSLPVGGQLSVIAPAAAGPRRLFFRARLDLRRLAILNNPGQGYSLAAACHGES